MECSLQLIGKSDIGLVKPLWEKLNALHLEDSRHFKDHYRTFTFEQRCGKFRTIDDDRIRIELVMDGEIPVGYCIATMDSSDGEIDSVYIEGHYRKRGFGRRLMENSIAWLKEHRCDTIRVAVAEGHESVYDFYRELGFYPRMTYFQMKG